METLHTFIAAACLGLAVLCLDLHKWSAAAGCGVAFVAFALLAFSERR